MAGRIEHQSAPGETRRIGNVHGGYFGRPGVCGIGGHQLPERHRTVKKPARITRANFNAIAGDIEHVGLRGPGGISGEAQPDAAGCIGRVRQFERDAARSRHEVDEVACNREGRRARSVNARSIRDR